MQKAFAADVIGRILVEPVFLAPGQYGVRAHWMGLVGYALQVFLDFAGYSLMALGCARLFGLRLPVNFNMPFLARSLFDFWRRWHITLNRWLFDYVYGPATTGQGFFRGRYAVGVLMVMLLSGLWHGAQWTFVSWGLFHGVGLMVNQRWLDYWRTLMRQDRKWKGVQQSAAYAGAALLLTQGWFLLSLVLFRSPDFGAAAAYFAGLLHGAGQALEVGGVNDKIELLLALLVAAGTHVRGVAWGSRMTEGFFKLPAPVRGIAYGLIIVLLCILTPVSSGAFIYRQF
jgi:D-alanyl-lipoteichoic acid acyltransferase DltB (MBOAT superfamily)